jgi:hypothetical protein
MMAFAAIASKRGALAEMDKAAIDVAKGKRLVIESGVEAEVNAGLTTMIAEAFAIRNQLCLDLTIASRR